MVFEIAEALKSGKIKPEFGNLEHIEALKILIREAEEAMLTTFDVTFNVSGTVSVRVKAHDKDEAEEIAKDEINMDDLDIDMVDVSSVDAVKEEVA